MNKKQPGVAEQPLTRTEHPVVNDFQIIVATVNGTGSQTANSTLIRALFRMGIPVNGKNIFPSNIQGLPTWFTIRLSRDGYVARREKSEVLVAMNQTTIADDIAALPAGGICLYPQEWAIRQERSDILYFPMPVKELLETASVPANLRDYIGNMVYVGVLAYLLNIDLTAIGEAVSFHFGGRDKPVQMNMGMVKDAFAWAEAHLPRQNRFCVEPMTRTHGKILMDGNSAAALGAVFGGVTFAAWYPITPSTSLADALNEYLGKLRRDPETGLATYAVIQAEDELAAAGMIVGAGWAGARSMTATSGPGISLMTEFAGLAYFAEIPAVIWDVQRMGPSTGLPTRTSQGDVLAAHYLGHGDTQHICLLPASVSECFEFGWRAFDLADRIQTPVFVLSDLDLGMNLWMDDPFPYPDQPIDRGKVLSADELARLPSWGRYRDVDGDGIAWRTLPGTPHRQAAYFTRGTGHNADAGYSERPDDWATNMARLREKFRTARQFLPAPVIDQRPDAHLGLIAYGTTDPAIVEGRDRLRAQGLETSYLRVRALPLEDHTRQFIEQYDRVVVVENNTDGQMARIICMEFPDLAPRVVSLAFSNGLPLSARWLTESLLAMESEGVK